MVWYVKVWSQDYARRDEQKRGLDTSPPGALGQDKHRNSREYPASLRERGLHHPVAFVRPYRFVLLAFTVAERV